MKYALITGANKGIGFETARQLLEKGYFVFLTCRDVAKGQDSIDKLKAMGYEHLQLINLDVCDDESVRKAAIEVAAITDHLDVLVNNAGIRGDVSKEPSEMSVAEIKQVFETNFFGVIRTTQAFMPLLRKATSANIVNVSSELGSLYLHNDPKWEYYKLKRPAYGPSKAAMNAYTIMLAYELQGSGIKVNAVNPGYTATDFNNHTGKKQVGDAAQTIVKYATLEADGPSGGYFSDYGVTPW